MKHNISALLASAVVALTLGTPVLAQGPGGGGPGGGGGGFGGQRQMPFTVGAVSAVDATAGTITITPQFGGNGPQTIKVGTDVQITTQTTATVAELKVGDQIAVQGVPTAITASQIIAGQAPAGLPGAGGPRGGGGPRPGGGGNGGGNGAASQAYATAGGTIQTLPTDAAPALVISMGTNVTVSLTIPSTTKITKYSTLTLAGVKVGDQVIAAGQADADGTFTATSVGVNMQMGNGGGFGGPGGFGGGRGGRGRRGGGGGGFGGPGGGGGFGGGGGNGAPPPPAPDGGAPPPPVQ